AVCVCVCVCACVCVCVCVERCRRRVCGETGWKQADLPGQCEGGEMSDRYGVGCVSKAQSCLCSLQMLRGVAPTHFQDIRPRINLCECVCVCVCVCICEYVCVKE